MTVWTEEMRVKRRQAQARYRRAHEDEHRARQRREGAERYLRRRQESLDLLGGVCVVCGTVDKLEFDHIDPREKSFAIGEHLHRSWDTLLPELAKCQLLCTEHHKDKTYNRGLIGYLLTHPSSTGVTA